MGNSPIKLAAEYLYPIMNGLPFALVGSVTSHLQPSSDAFFLNFINRDTP